MSSGLSDGALAPNSGGLKPEADEGLPPPAAKHVMSGFGKADPFMAKQHILIVEDSPYVAGSIQDAVDMMGYDARVAGSAAEAFKAIAEHVPDLVLLDWMLPDLEGIEVLQRIRSGPHPKLPVIMLTAKGELEAKLTGLEAGADDYLPKPFNLGELKARIVAILRRQTPS